MPSFFAYDFIFDDVPSQKFDLKIINFEDGSLFEGVGSSDVEILSQSVLRKSKPYYLGRTQPTVLEFPLMFGTAQEITALDRDMISAWLFGRAGYKKLYILQDDLNGAYFNCFLKEPVPLYIGNLNFAFQCTVVCDSPWAYGPEHVITTGSFNTTQVDWIYNYKFNIYNASSEDEYLYPQIRFSVGMYPIPQFWIAGWAGHSATGGYNDNHTWAKFYNLVAGEEVIINNDLQIIKNAPPSMFSPTIDTPILSRFNKWWIKLGPRANIIELAILDTDYAEISSFELRYTERFKVGG